MCRLAAKYENITHQLVSYRRTAVSVYQYNAERPKSLDTHGRVRELSYILITALSCRTTRYM